MLPAGPRLSVRYPLLPVGTRGELLKVVRRHPGITVSEVAGALGLSGMGVRRHLDAMVGEGLVSSSPVPAARRPAGPGRPALGWHLTTSGQELFPRRYDLLALDLLVDLAEQGGEQAVDGALHRQSSRLRGQYAGELEGVAALGERVALLAEIRDRAGYESHASGGGTDELVLTEANCAVRRVAERCPAMCRTELELFREVLGPDVEVVRVAHVMAGDPVCAYRIAPCAGSDMAASTPAAPE